MKFETSGCLYNKKKKLIGIFLKNFTLNTSFRAKSWIQFKIVLFLIKLLGKEINIFKNIYFLASRTPTKYIFYNNITQNKFSSKI